jgi:hypothetical protein
MGIVAVSFKSSGRRTAAAFETRGPASKPSSFRIPLPCGPKVEALAAGPAQMLENQRSRRLFLLAVLLGPMSAPAHAADWRLTATRHTRFGSSLSFLDMQSIRGGKGQVQFSTLTFFSRRTKGMNRVAAVVGADCGTMTYRFHQISLFWNQLPLSQWHSASAVTAKPDSNVFDAISTACGNSEAGTHIERMEAFAADYFGKRHRRTAAG